MAHFAGGNSSGAGGAPESNWPLSLDKPLTEELHSYGLLVPPGCRLAKPWKVSKDGYPTQGDPATPEELRTHPGGRHNIRGRHAIWDGKSYYDVITRHRQAAAATGNAGGINPPPPAGGPGGGPSGGPAGAYMALNKDNTHWVTVVMHKEKEEFQVLDSMGKELQYN
ncbi:hypothetical protein ZWY2020_059083 [Hordeum vulgare]|nr:hypothetical protein ZWY2020_059083 [Hordeum vulgare]